MNEDTHTSSLFLPTVYCSNVKGDGSPQTFDNMVGHVLEDHIGRSFRIWVI